MSADQAQLAARCRPGGRLQPEDECESGVNRAKLLSTETANGRTKTL